MDVFVKINDSTSDLSWMGFSTDCLEFRFSDFQFPSGSTQHRVYLTGSSHPPTTDNLWDGAIVKVYSNLKSSSLPLNQYLSVRQPASGFAFSAGYWSGGRAKARIYEAEFSLLGTYFTIPADIDEEALRFNSTVTIFGKYATQISGEVPTGYTWDDVPFTVSGEFETGPSSFIYSLDEYTQNYAATKVTLAKERVSNAEAARNTTQRNLATIQALYNAKMSAATESALNYQQALEKVTQAAAVVNTLQQELDNANQEMLEAQNTITDVCMIVDCPTVCAPEITCQSCDNLLTFNNWGYSDEVRVDRLVDYREVSTTVYRWEYQRQCRIVTKIQRWAEVSFGQICSYVSLPREVSFKEEEAYLKPLNISHIAAKPKTSDSLLMSQVCCVENSCGLIIPSILCASENVACQLAQQPAYEALNETQDALVAPLQQLSEAVTNLTLARAEASLAKTNKNITELDFQLFQPTFNAITEAAATQENNYQQVLTEEQAILNLNSFLSNVTIQELVNVLGLAFSVSFQESSPSIIPVTITGSIPLLNETFNITLMVDLAAPTPILQRAIADQVLSQVGSILASGQAALGKRKRSVIQSPPTVQHFERKCAAITNLKWYLIQLNTTIDDAVTHLEIARSNISTTIGHIRLLTTVPPTNLSNINFTLLEDKFGITDPRDTLGQQAQNSTVVVQLKENTNSIAAATQALLDQLDGDIFIHWQKAMGTVSTVSDTPCYGFADCLTIVGRLVQELLEDTPGDMATNLLQILPAAKQTLAELALVARLTPGQAKLKTVPMLNILKGMEIIGYWCSTPPVITRQPEKKVNVDLWKELSIMCYANSSLPLSYSWKKGGFVQPSFTSSTLTKSRVMYDDEGKYQCSVTNDIATTDSLYSTVEVFEPPVITLSPLDFTTFEGDDNGALFVCNATGRPSPTYEWYWSTNGMDWSAVSNSSSNELFLSKPLKKDQGWYRCRAFTDNGMVYSGLARLTILSVSVSRLVYPVSFQLDLVQTIEISGSGPDTDMPDTTQLIKQALISTLDESLGLSSRTTKIGNIVISVSLNNSAIISFDVFTEYDLPLNETLVNTALNTQVNQRDIMEMIPRFWQLLRNNSFRLEAGVGIFAVKINSIAIGNLKYACPSGTVLQYNNFLCGM